MAVTCRLFRTIAAHFHMPAEIMMALNATLAENNESNMFCTAFLGVLDLKTGNLQYCNAGHNAPVIIEPTGEVKFMEVVPNLPFGLFGDFPYEGQECDLVQETFGQYVAVELSEENKRQLFIPRGFAHGFLVLSEEAVFTYKVDNVYAPQADAGIIYNDPQIGIKWDIEADKVLLSEKDCKLPKLADAVVFE